MSVGCYLEIVNRAFSEVNVTFVATNANDWENNKFPSIHNKEYTLNETKYYRSNNLEIGSNLSPHGCFYLEFKIEKDNIKTSILKLEEGRGSGIQSDYLKFKDADCILLLTRGKTLERIDNMKKDGNKGCFRVELFRLSKRRFGVMNDYHFGHEEYGTTGRQTKDVEQICKLRNRPEFIVMPGDLLAVTTPPNNNKNPFAWDDYRDIWDNFINPLERKGIFVADGFGNHDLYTGTFSKDVKEEIKSRNKDRKINWKFMNFAGSKDYKSNNNDNYHYRWYIELCNTQKKVLVVFFMLNNLPANSNRKDPGDSDSSHEEGTYAYGALDFLKDSLDQAFIENKNSYDAIVGILCHHINYNADNRWWTDNDKKLLKKVLDKSKTPVIFSVFGHAHHEDIQEEFLKVEGKQSYLGYRCACSIWHRHLNLFDLELTSEGNIKLTSYYQRTDMLQSDEKIPQENPLQKLIEVKYRD